MLAWMLAGALLFGVGLATAGPAVSVVETKVERFQPVLPTGSPRRGRCDGPSTALMRDDAWVCKSGFLSWDDPCFSFPSGNLVLCGADPARGKPGVLVEAVGGLPKTRWEIDLKAPHPGIDDDSYKRSIAQTREAAAREHWIIELADGTLCQSYPFPNDVYPLQLNDERLYRCESDRTTPVWVGGFVPGKVWTAQRFTVRKKGPGDAGYPGFMAVDPQRVEIRRIWD